MPTEGRDRARRAKPRALEPHDLLREQLAVTGLDCLPRDEWPAAVAALLREVDGAYSDYDREYRELVATAERNEREMQEIYLRLLQDHEKLSTVLDSFSVALIYVDARWNVRFMNSQAEQALAWKSSELAERNLLNAVDICEADGDVPFDVLECERAMAAGLPYVSENATFRTRTGDRVPVFYSVNPTNNFASGFVLVFRDLSAKRNAAVALREARLEAEAARRAEHAKSDFLAKMSHEMRTPMHAILSFARFGRDRAETAERAKLEDFFDKIDISARRLLRLFDRLLDLSKLESGTSDLRVESVALDELVEAVVDECRPLFEERSVGIVTDRLARIDVVCDEGRIMQVVRNLLGNAAKFSPEGRTIEVTLVDRGDRVEVGILDEGVGIPKAELETIFDKFVQSSRTATGAGGTGLGLAISHEIVALHGGEIWAENRDPTGAAFRFSLPVRCAGASVEEVAG